MKTAGKFFIIISLVIFAFSVSSLVSALGPAAPVRDYPADKAQGTMENTFSGEPSDEGTLSEEQDEYNAYKYILKSENGKVMLYTAGNGISPKEVNIPYLDLPLEDRALLDQGIVIKNERQLLSVIEDYTS